MAKKPPSTASAQARNIVSRCHEGSLYSAVSATRGEKRGGSAPETFATAALIETAACLLFLVVPVGCCRAPRWYKAAQL